MRKVCRNNNLASLSLVLGNVFRDYFFITLLKNKMEEAIKKLLKIIDSQADNVDLWTDPETEKEKKLRRALYEIHACIETAYPLETREEECLL